MEQSDQNKAPNKASGSPTSRSSTTGTGTRRTPATGARKTTGTGTTGSRTGSKRTSTAGGAGAAKASPGGGADKKAAITATARKQISETVDRKSTEIGGKVSSAAATVRDVGRKLEDKPAVAKVTETLADRVEGIAGYLTSSSPEQLVSDIRGLAAREPLLFAGACFAVGLFAARLVKAATHDGGGAAGTGSPNGSSTPATAGSSTGTGTRSRTASPSGRGS